MLILPLTQRKGIGKHNEAVSSCATKVASIASEIGAGVMERKPALPLPIRQLAEMEQGEYLECHLDQQLTFSGAAWRRRSGEGQIQRLKVCHR